VSGHQEPILLIKSQCAKYSVMQMQNSKEINHLNVLINISKCFWGLGDLIFNGKRFVECLTECLGNLGFYVNIKVYYDGGGSDS
jgi:hypothetical protein